MRRHNITAWLAVSAILCCFVSAQISAEYIKQSEASVRRAIDDKDLDFEALYQEGVVYKALTESNVIQNSNLCSILQKYTDLDEALTTARDVYYFLKLRSFLPRCNLEFSQEQAKEVLLRDLSSIQTAEAVFFVAALANELADANVLQQVCALNGLYLQNDGTARRVVTDPESTSYTESAYILETVELCLSKAQIEHETALKLIDVPLESILLNSIALEPYHLCILEGTETFEITARLFRLFNTLPIQSLKSFAVFAEKYRNALLRFIKSNANSAILSIAEKYAVIRVYMVSITSKSLLFIAPCQKQDVEDTDVLVVKKNNAYTLSDKENVAHLRFENVLGEISKKTAQVQGSILRRGVRVFAETFNSTATSNESWPIAITTKQVKEPGAHVLQVALNKQDLLEERFTVKTTVRVRNIEFEITQGKGKIPKKYTHSFNERNKKALEKITANQNSFIFVQFSLSFAEGSTVNFTPTQIAVHLRHPTFKGVTHMVTADYDEIQNRYLAILDLGDPNMILPYSALYEADLIVADERLVKPVTITFAKVDATFKTARDGKNPPNDADYVLQKPIVNIVEDAIKSPPFIFVSVFVVMMATCLVFFFQLVSRIQLNKLRFERINAQQKITVQAFFVAILIAFGLLVVFWVQINLLQTVTYICIGVIPFIFIGNLALNDLSGNKE